MSYQVLARKWRPRTFASLVGQEHVVRALTHALEQQRLHHAYLFTGTRGVGKTTLARILAKSLNCETGVTATPCGTCSSCREIDAGRFVDLIEVDAATNTKVDEMRQLLDNAVYAPTRGRFKVYVIDEVHMLSNSAFNAMLKTLEEPPEHIKFILATTDPQKIPVTVLSRCLQFNLKNMPPSAIAAHLERVLREEGVAVEAAALGLLAHAARGSMRDGLSLLDQALAYAGGAVTEAAVRGMLGTVDTGYLFDLLEAVVARDAPRALGIADAMEARSLSWDNALGELARLLHRVALAQTAAEVLAEDAPERGRVLALARAIDPEDVQLQYQIVLHGRQDLPLAPDEYTGFTMTIMRMLAFVPASAGGVAASPAEGLGSPARAAPTAAASADPTAAREHRTGSLKMGKAAGSPSPVAAAGDSRGASGSSALPGASRVAPEADAGVESRLCGAGGELSAEAWPALARSLNVTGAVKQLAERSELLAWRGGRIQLAVAPESRTLADRAYVERLKAAIGDALGREVDVAVVVGAVAGRTVAALDESRRQLRQEEANAQVDGDPFVRELVAGFGATIESIQPVEKAQPS